MGEKPRAWSPAKWTPKTAASRSSVSNEEHTVACSDFGIENLIGLVRIHKANPSSAGSQIPASPRQGWLKSHAGPTASSTTRPSSR